jgi:hypothetical protein
MHINNDILTDLINILAIGRKEKEIEDTLGWIIMNPNAICLQPGDCMIDDGCQ